MDYQMIDVAEVAGAANGLLGAWLLAFKTPYAKFGWVAYLISNVFWLAFALILARQWMLVQTVGFTVSSVVGLWNHVLPETFKRMFVRAKSDTEERATRA